MKNKIFKSVLFCSAVIVVLLMVGIFFSLITQAGPVVRPDGMVDYSIVFPLIAGTVFVAFTALILAIPFSMYLALFAGEYYKGTKIAFWIKNILTVNRNIPAIVWGIGAYLFVRDWGIFAAPVVLALMIIPYASHLLISFFATVPKQLRESAYCLGATSTEVIRGIIFPYTKKEIIAAYLMALGKALGETMIVTILAGNTITRAILNQFGTSDHLGGLFTLAFGLLMVTAGINSLANRLIRRIAV